LRPHHATASYAFTLRRMMIAVAVVALLARAAALEDRCLLLRYPDWHRLVERVENPVRPRELAATEPAPES
jgi:hypothetical protein